MLFLDLDGVLHPAEATEFFEASCLAALRRLLQMDCDLVLSSTWRCKEALRREACPDRINTTHYAYDIYIHHIVFLQCQFAYLIIRKMFIFISFFISYYQDVSRSVGLNVRYEALSLHAQCPIGDTPRLRGRAEEILAWLRDHGGDVWLALDDMPLELPEEHVVRTDAYRGCLCKQCVRAEMTSER